MNNYTRRIIATNASSLARLLGLTVSIEAEGLTFKAVPEDRPEDVLARNGVGPDPVPVLPAPPDPSEVKLVTRPGEKVDLFTGPVAQWIGRPDPGYRGETKQVVPFDNFEEG